MNVMRLIVKMNINHHETKVRGSQSILKEKAKNFGVSVEGVKVPKDSHSKSAISYKIYN